MKKKLRIYIGGVIAVFLASSCHSKLDLYPVNDITAEVVYSTPEGYKQAFAKVYAAYALTGGGGSGSSDLAGIDAGTSDFLRLYWNAQVLTTDEGVCAWVQDPGVPDLNFNEWNSNNVMLRGLYTRSLYQITVANEFLRESTDEKLASRNITGADAEAVRGYRVEARFLRAYQYWVLMDLFGNPPFVTENDPISKVPPQQISRADLFAYVESELLDMESQLVGAKQNEYGRADQVAAWALLARLYINSEVYLGAGNGKFDQAVEFASRVINSGYTLKPNYRHLFLADSDQVRDEIILSINYDAVRSQNFGGTTFIINSSTNGAMDPASLGIANGGWGGNRSRPSLPQKFDDRSGETDTRAMFWGETPSIDDVSVFDQGLAVTKFKNIDRNGQPAPSNDQTQVSVDFPLFRAADAYLIYAEAVLRGGNGNMATALEYVNALRARAYNGAAAGNVSSINLDFILDERAREFYWEGYRRTDLIRFGKYTGNAYLWPYKGGAQSGKTIPDYLAIFPLPSSDVIANPNLTQNTGY